MATERAYTEAGNDDPLARKREIVLDFLKKRRTAAPSRPSVDGVVSPARPVTPPAAEIKINFLEAARQAAPAAPSAKTVPPRIANKPAAPAVLPKPQAKKARPARPAKPRPALSWLAYGLAGLGLALAGYLIFCLYLYSFRPAAGWPVRLARHLPVPVLISRYGAVDYYQFLELRQRLEAGGVSRDELDSLAVAAAVEWQIIESLARQYQLSPHLSTAGLIMEVGKAVISDRRLNGDAFSTVSRIKQAVAAGQPFDQAAAGQGVAVQTEYFDQADAFQKFGAVVTNLKPGELSSIIVLPDGLYLLELVGHIDQALELKYVKVGQKTLAQIIGGQLAQTKVINFIKR